MPYSFPHVPVGHEASPNVNTPPYSHGETPYSPLVGSHIGQSPIHGFNSRQPSPEVYGSIREHFPKNKERNHGGTNKEARHWQQRSNGYQKDLEQCRLNIDRSIRLFQCLKDLKKYDEAEELYHEISKEYDVSQELHDMTERGRESDTNDDTKMLGLNHTFAEMLIEQQKFQEAEPISRAVWERRKDCPGTPSEDFRKSHRQLCSVLRALGKSKDAERMHNDMYQREPKDEWALENGDEVCQTLKEQKELQKAKILQEEVWKKRLEKNSERELTIQSGVRLIGFLEELNKTVDCEGDTEAERKWFSSTRQALNDEIRVILEKIWPTRLEPEPNANILDVGHKLGVRLLRDKKFLKAERILQIVWENKKRVQGEDIDSTMSSGSMLGSAMRRQGTHEKYSDAVDILRPILIARQDGVGNCDAEAISSIKDLAQAYSALGKLQDSEIVYDWICHQMQQGGYTTLEVERVRWELGVTLHKQGKNKNQKAILVLKEVYERWKRVAHNSDETLECGQMLAQSLSTHDGKFDEALKVAQEVFEKRDVSGERGVPYLEIAQLYGSLLLTVGRKEDARNVLRSAWKCQPGNLDEQKLRWKCGHLFGQALAGINKYPSAKRILEAVITDQREALPPGSPELEQTHQLLEMIQQEKGRKRGSTKPRLRGR